MMGFVKGIHLFFSYKVKYEIKKLTFCESVFYEFVRIVYWEDECFEWKLKMFVVMHHCYSKGNMVKIP